MWIKFHTIVTLLSLSRLTSSVLWNGDDKTFVAPDDTTVVFDDSGTDLSAQDIRDVDFSETLVRVENEVVHTGVPAANKNGRKSKAMLRTFGGGRKKRGVKKTKSPKYTKSPIETKNPSDGKGYLKATKSPMETKNLSDGKGCLNPTKVPTHTKSPMETKNPSGGKGYLKTTKLPARNKSKSSNWRKSDENTKTPIRFRYGLKSKSSNSNKSDSNSSKSNKNTKSPKCSVKETKAPMSKPPILFVLEICTSCLIDSFSTNFQNEIESLILEFGFKNKVEANEIQANIEVTNDECLPCTLNTDRRNLQDENNNEITLLQNILSVEIKFLETNKRNRFNSSKVIANLVKNKEKINEILQNVGAILNDVQYPSSSPSQQPSISMFPSSSPSSMPSILPTQLPTSAPSSK